MKDGPEIDLFSVKFAQSSGVMLEVIDAKEKGNYTHSYMTILTASFNKLSPKMTVYSLGSTLYWLKMARMVTGSVADRVEPKVKLSTSDRSIPSMPRNEYMWTRTLHATVSEPFRPSIH